MRRAKLRSMFALAAVAFLTAGCLQVLGLDEYKEGNGGAASTGSTSDSSNSSSGSGTCVVDAPCYSGADGTEGKGNCKAGTQVCDGVTLVSCMGEVVPASEDFALKGDEDCDGHARADLISAIEHSGDFMAVQDMTTDAAGNLIIVGFLDPSVNFGPAPTDALIAQQEQDFFVAKFDSSGKFVWSKRFGDSTNEVFIRVAATSTGEIWLTGFFKSQITFGTTTLSIPGSGGTFVTLLDANGEPQRTRLMSEVAPGSDIAVLPDGDAVVSVNYDSAVDVGQGYSFTTTSRAAYIARLSRGTLDTVWAKPIGDALAFAFPDGTQEVRAVAADSAGNILATGVFDGGVFTDEGEPLLGAGKHDGFVLRLTPDGDQTNLLAAAGAGDVSIDAVAVDPTGAFAVTGSFSESLRLLDVASASATLQTTGPTDNDFFVWKLTASGKHAWSKKFGDGTDQNSPDPIFLSSGFSATIDGRILWGSRYRGSMMLGDTALTSLGDDDAFVAVLAANGTVEWAKSFGDPTPIQLTTAITPFGANSFAVALFNGGSMDLGGGPLAAAPPNLFEFIVATFEL